MSLPKNESSPKTTEEKKTLEKIIEQIGPYGLIAVCMTLVVNVTSRPLDSNSWVSIGILGVVIIICFFFDWLRMKNSSAIEEIRIKSQLEFDKHKSWVDGNRPLVESSSIDGQLRIERIKVFHSIRELLSEDLKKGKLTTAQEEYCQDLIDKLVDIERTVSMF